jgi:ATP-binding cassette subfamily B protein
VAQLVVLLLGVYFIASGNFTLGLLVGYFLYVNNFYQPLRQMAQVWSSLQQALAALDRISEVLSLESDMPLLPANGKPKQDAPLLEFKNVTFKYPDGKEVLKDISISLERGKSYALVGPTGGGKTTTASLMARLYDPTHGSVFLDGVDIRTLEPASAAKKSASSCRSHSSLAARYATT